MFIHEFDLPRIHNAALLAEAEEERLGRLARQARQPRPLAIRTVARFALVVGVPILLVVHALPMAV
jgi:hypothetical protein